jgi:hypothetical protein
VIVGVSVAVTVNVPLGVEVMVGENVAVAVTVPVEVIGAGRVGVGVKVAVPVWVDVAMAVCVPVSGDDVLVGVRVGDSVTNNVGDAMIVSAATGVGDAVGVFGTGVFSGGWRLTVGDAARVGEAVAAATADLVGVDRFAGVAVDACMTATTSVAVGVAVEGTDPAMA